jgi:hypothetical protein
VQKRRRIDVRAHCVAQKYRAALQAAGHGRPSGMPGIPAWSIDLPTATMDRLGIGSALLSISAPGLHFGDDTAARELTRHVNDAGAEPCRYPTHFGLIASLPLLQGIYYTSILVLTIPARPRRLWKSAR